MDQGELLKQLRIDRSEPEVRSRGWIAALVIGLALVLAAGAWWWLRGGAVIEVEAATAAAPSSAAAGSAAVLQATGYVVARRQATVSAQITGTLTQVLIEEGERVEKGQVLATLEDTAQKAMLAQAQANLRSAQAQLVQARTQLAQNQRDLTRADDLVARQLVSKQAAELARTQVESQRALVDAQARQVEVAQASVAGAQVQLDYCTVRAPFSGVVIAKAAQVGEIVSPLSAGGGFTRTGVGTIVDMDSLEIEVDVNESYIHRVSADQPTEAVLDAYQDWKIPGHVIAIIPTADRSKATVKVRVALSVKDPRIVPDMGVRVSFLEAAKPQQAEQPKGVRVPGAAVVERDGAQVAFVVGDDDTVQQRSLKVAGKLGDDVHVTDGLQAGETVVLDPPAELKDGAKVVLAEDAE